VIGTASDNGPGVASVQGRLWRPDNSTAWNGTSWVAATSLPQAPNLPVTGTTSWTFALPSLAPATYLFQPIARDYIGNVTFGTPVRFTISAAAQSSSSPDESVTLSNAQAGGSEITLIFTGPLGTGAQSPATWQVTANGRSVGVESASVVEGTVTLRLAQALSSKAEVAVTWSQLRDAQGRAVGGSWRGTAN
jgi:hypothetical protein